LLAGSANARVVVHHDRSSCALERSELDPDPRLLLLPESVSVDWGGSSMIAATLCGLRWILENLRDFDWVVFLSAQDYPIKRLAGIEAYLAKTNCDAFIEYREIGPDDVLFDRYSYRYYGFPRPLRGLFVRLRAMLPERGLVVLRPGPSAACTPRIGLRRLKTIFHGGFRCYKGSQWFMLNAEAVRYVFRYLFENPSFERYYARSFIPDESFFQTLLVNNPALRIANDNKRLTLWSDSNAAHPEVLTEDHWPNLAANEDFFARKFDIDVDAAVLDRIDREILEAAQ
jgi:hypothetical protein